MPITSEQIPKADEDMELKEQIGGRLKAWRGDRTQLDLAVALGTTPQTISQWENGGIPPSLLLLHKIASENADLNWLILGKKRRAA